MCKTKETAREKSGEKNCAIAEYNEIECFWAYSSLCITYSQKGEHTMKTGKRIISLLLVVVLLLSTQVVVFAETVLAIDIATLPDKLTYTEEETLDVIGGELTVYYSGSQEVIPITEDMVTGFDSTVLGTQTLRNL